METLELRRYIRIAPISVSKFQQPPTSPEPTGRVALETLESTAMGTQMSDLAVHEVIVLRSGNIYIGVLQTGVRNVAEGRLGHEARTGRLRPHVRM